MVSKEKLLSILPPFKGIYKIIVSKQIVEDIVTGVPIKHNECKRDYDLIYTYFDSDSVYGIANNLFNFLKKNVPYIIDDQDAQDLNTPAAILERGGDCKSYALFIGGVLDAFNRNENEDIPFSYRFASYDRKDKSPEHVFVVIYPDTDQELWIDPVLFFLDERKIPYFHHDKIIKPMALRSVSGINNQQSVAGLDDVIDIFVPGGGSVLDGLFHVFGIGGNDAQENDEYTSDPRNTVTASRYYLQRYQDVRPPEWNHTAFKHYIDFGKGEGRTWIEPPGVTNPTGATSSTGNQPPVAKKDNTLLYLGGAAVVVYLITRNN